jgi:hypothetical protein
MLPV